MVRVLNDREKEKYHPRNVSTNTIKLWHQFLNDLFFNCGTIDELSSKLQECKEIWRTQSNGEKFEQIETLFGLCDGVIKRNDKKLFEIYREMERGFVYLIDSILQYHAECEGLAI